MEDHKLSDNPNFFETRWACEGADKEPYSGVPLFSGSGTTRAWTAFHLYPWQYQASDLHGIDIKIVFWEKDFRKTIRKYCAASSKLCSVLGRRILHPTVSVLHRHHISPTQSSQCPNKLHSQNRKIVLHVGLRKWRLWTPSAKQKGYKYQEARRARRERLWRLQVISTQHSSRQ